MADTYSAFCHLLNVHHNIFDLFHKLDVPFRYVGILTTQQLNVVQEEQGEQEGQRSNLTKKRET